MSCFSSSRWGLPAASACTSCSSSRMISAVRHLRWSGQQLQYTRTYKTKSSKQEQMISAVRHLQQKGQPVRSARSAGGLYYFARVLLCLLLQLGDDQRGAPPADRWYRRQRFEVILTTSNKQKERNNSQTVACINKRSRSAQTHNRQPAHAYPPPCRPRPASAKATVQTPKPPSPEANLGQRGVAADVISVAHGLHRPPPHPPSPEVDLGQRRVCVDVVAHVQDVVTLHTQRSLHLCVCGGGGKRGSSSSRIE